MEPKIKTKGYKLDTNKPRPSLLPMGPMLELCALYAKGSEKYGDRNWEYGMVWSRVFDALIRHAFKWWGGEEFDQEDGQHHLTSVAWNALALMEYVKTHPELDDRFKSPKVITVNIDKMTETEISLLQRHIDSYLKAEEFKNGSKEA